MVRVAFLVEKMITLAGFFKLFFTMFPCDIFFSLIWLSFLLIFSAFFHEGLTIAVIFLVFIMKVLFA
ncbi:hypothetical protein CON07_05520 [Bacillus sp. AFS094611]|uniref:Uncharacterized protein n=1 Tax=Bacillus anthracis TaxID=1392 RepID=A0A2A7D734_BACAN|nr:hypothetical protein CON16_17345 [Bacillus anthracis]PDZ52450.1 hypothetical protein CON07_05520 [Bacillus sp. AFS094611]